MATNPTIQQNTTIVNRLFWFVLIAVLAIAAGSFTLSFMALYALAVSNGIPALLGWIWPLIVDLSMVIYTAAVLVAQLQRRSARLPIALTVFYAIVTVTGNILHATNTPLGWFVAALPPLSLILGSEMLRVMGKHNIERQGAMETLSELAQHTHAMRYEITQLEQTIVSKQAQLNALKSDIAQTKSSNLQEMRLKANQAKQQVIENRREQVLHLLQGGSNEKDIATQLNKDIRTIKADIIALNGRAIEVQA